MTTDTDSAQARPGPLMPSTAATDPDAPPEGWSDAGPGFLAALAFAAVTVQGALMAAGLLTVSLKASAIAPDSATTTLSIAVGVAGPLDRGVRMQVGAMTTVLVALGAERSEGHVVKEGSVVLACGLHLLATLGAWRCPRRRADPCVG